MLKRLFIIVTVVVGLIFISMVYVVSYKPSFNTAFKCYIHESVPESLSVMGYAYSQPFGEPPLIFILFNLAKTDTQELMEAFDFREVNQARFVEERLDEFWDDCQMTSSNPIYPYEGLSDGPLFVPLFVPKRIFIKSLPDNSGYTRKGLLLIDESETKLFYTNIDEMIVPVHY